MVKHCRHCGKTKKRTEFYSWIKRGTTGRVKLCSRCKECDLKHASNRRKANPELHAQYTRNWRLKSMVGKFSPWSGMKRCRLCGDEKLKSRFKPRRKKDTIGWKPQYDSLCRKCRRTEDKKKLSYRLRTRRAAKRKKLRLKQQGKWPKVLKTRRLMRKYNLKKSTYDAMLVKQGGLCDCCHKKPTQFQVDHNHKTGKVRGLVCAKCNQTIYHVEEHSARIALARKYLEKYNGSAQDRPMPTLWAPVADETDSAALREM